MKKPVLGIQLFTLMRHIQNAEDFDETLKRLSETGVDTVQISGIGDFPVEEQKEILDRYSMKVCITHQDYEDFTENLPKVIKRHEVLDCNFAGLGCIAEDLRQPYDNIQKVADNLDAAGEELKKYGLEFAYHNHDFEFRTLENSDKTQMDVFLEKENINFIPDVAWMHYAGVDPAGMLRRMGDRVKVIHFKDYIIDENNELKFVSLGKGKVNLKECYEVACELEIPYIVYEQDRDWVDDDAFLATKQSWDFMKSLERE